MPHTSEAVQHFGWYAILLSAFHFSEYYVTALTNPVNLSTDSFLLNHSREYSVAAALSWLEFWSELHLVPELKSGRLLSWVGLALCVAGEALRKAAMFHAGRNFNHIVQSDKKADHLLVTSGVFSWMRHPSYVGWFYWSVGTQLVLGNPICSVAYAIVSWQFFAGRIYIEEYNLLQFFGDDYVNYQRHVSTGLPFISGYKLAE
jgi:protein-S-isoprenylcysteine O-methyltransferase